MTPEKIKNAATEALEAYDGFMSGAELTLEQIELQQAVARAGMFAAGAYNAAPTGGNDVHALIRSFLLALIDPACEELDYLRADPAAGPVAREAAARLQELTKSN